MGKNIKRRNREEFVKKPLPPFRILQIYATPGREGAEGLGKSSRKRVELRYSTCNVLAQIRRCSREGTGIMVDQPFDNKGTSRFEEFGKKVDERFNQALPRVEEGAEESNRLSQRPGGAPATAGFLAGAARRRGSIAQIGRTARRRPRSALRWSMARPRSCGPRCRSCF